jgi:quercetin dioxygenase-like cupin family protein
VQYFNYFENVPFEEVRKGVKRAGFQAQNVMLVMNVLEPGMDTNPHVHSFEQVAFIMQGRAIYHVGDQHEEVGPGSVFAIPAGVRHYIEPIGDEPVYNLDVFAPPREDYRHLVEYQRGR